MADHRLFVEVKDRGSGAHYWVREDAVSPDMHEPTRAGPRKSPGPVKHAVSKDGTPKRTSTTSSTTSTGDA